MFQASAIIPRDIVDVLIFCSFCHSSYLL